MIQNDSFDSRSDDQGAELEGLAVGKLGDRTYAFMGKDSPTGSPLLVVTNEVSDSTTILAMQ